MAKILGMVGMSHIPAIGKAINDKKYNDPYWEPFFGGFPPVREWVEQEKPTTLVVFYNDHGLNFFLDQMPTFAIGTAPTYTSADEGWGIPVFSDYPGQEDLSWKLVEALNEAEFDMVVCQEMILDHSVTIPIELLWPGQAPPPVKIVPININTVLFPTPSPSRCMKLGKVVGKVIEEWDADERVLILGTGGLSHQLEGKRAGFINKEFDLTSMEKLENEVDWFSQYSSRDIVELAGTQGLELLNWIAARSAISEKMKIKHQNYHIPISNTASALYLLEPAE